MPMVCIAVGVALTAWSCREMDMNTEPSQLARGGGGGGGGRPGGESLGNNLSFPVIFADGVEKVLRGTFGTPDYRGEDLWYFWDGGLCKAVVVGDCPDPLPEGSYAVYQQQGESNWRAESLTLTPGTDPALYVNWIDWGDNLESVPWYLNSKVRTEVVLIQDLLTPMLAFEMAWIEGLGINELWGTTTIQDPAFAQATVYSHCARLYIQRLYVSRDAIPEGALGWEPGIGWIELDPEGEDLIGEPFVNKPVWSGGDGRGYYSAEINVKGKIIYGYNWDVKKENEGDGHYRITFALDANYCSAPLNTFFNENTEILVPVEEEVTIEEEPSGEGGLTYLDPANNLTYIDIIIEEGKGQGGGGNGPGGGGNGGNGPP
jgi:hypothetical protein